MNDVLSTIVAILLLIGMILFTLTTIIADNIDEFIDWLDKRVNKR